jgi:hypothetical protein
MQNSTGHIWKICVFVLWHVDPLLGNDRQISNYAKVVAL